MWNKLEHWTLYKWSNSWLRSKCKSPFSAWKYVPRAPGGLRLKTIAVSAKGVFVKYGDIRLICYLCLFIGHVIARENFLAVALDKGPSGLNLDFSYQMRDSPQLVDIIIIIDYLQFVPDCIISITNQYSMVTSCVKWTLFNW